MGPDSMCGILPQTPMALLVIKEQVSNTQAIYLHMFQLPQNRVALQYVHNHPCIPRKHGRTGSTRAISHHHLQHHGVFFCWGLTGPFPNDIVYKCIGQPCMENHGASSNDVYSPWLSGEYISPESLHLSGSITGTQQLSVIIYKYNLQAPRLLA